MVFNIVTITKFPLVTEDEAWMSDSAWHFVKSGNFDEPMFSGLIEFKNGYFAFGRIYLLAQAGIFKVLGLDFWQARVLSLITGFVSLLLAYLIGSKLYGRSIGLMAFFLFALSGLFFFNAHNGRPEMAVTSVVLLAVYLYLLARERSSPTLFFLTGLVSALSMDVHLNSVFLPLALALFFLIDEKAEFWRSKFFWLFISGAGLGVIYWSGVHILPDAKLFFAQAFSELGGGRHQPLQILGEGLRYRAYFFNARLPLSFLEGIYLLAAIVYAARHRTKTELKLLTVIFSYVLIMALLIGNKSSFYLVTLLPFADILLAKMAFDLFNAERQPLLRTIAIGALALLFIGYVGQLAALTIVYRQGDYDHYLSRIRKNIPAGAVVMGQPALWYGVADHPFYSTYYLHRVLFSGEKSVKDKLGHTFAEALKVKKVRYFIADGYYMSFQLTPHKKLKRHVLAFFRTHARLVGVVKDRYNSTGKIRPTRIYKIVSY